VVEDSEFIRKFHFFDAWEKPALQIVGEVIDGLEAVQRAENCIQIVLDIGLPSLNVIEVARRVRKLLTEFQNTFRTPRSSADVVQEAATGARGYVVKTDAGSELLEGFFRVSSFVGRRFYGHDFVDASRAGASRDLQSNRSCPQLTETTDAARRLAWGSILTMSAG